MIVMKGISEFANYLFIILFGFVVMILFTTLIYGYYENVLKMNIQVSLKQIASQTSDTILYLYEKSKESNSNPKNSSSITLSNIVLNYPNQVSGKNFELELVSSSGIWNQVSNVTINNLNVTIMKETSSGAKIIAKTRQKPIVIYEYDVPNVPIKIQGKYTSGGNDTLRLVRYNYNDNVEDVIILGNSSVIIEITTIN